MSDLIDRTWAQVELKRLSKRYTFAYEKDGCGTVVWSNYLIKTSDALDALRMLPSAQPDIIRCKDCRWQKDQSKSTAWLPCGVIVTPSDFYCGRAERRTDVK